jgi:hypothetical protein
MENECDATATATALLSGMLFIVDRDRWTGGEMRWHNADALGKWLILQNIS